jgi:hypothetical protein
MRIINNVGITGDLLIDMYWHRLSLIIDGHQLSLIQFDDDCIRMFNLDGSLLTEMSYFNEVDLFKAV